MAARIAIAIAWNATTRTAMSAHLVIQKELLHTWMVWCVKQHVHLEHMPIETCTNACLVKLHARAVTVDLLIVIHVTSRARRGISKQASA
jgi:hypothetical protein